MGFLFPYLSQANLAKPADQGQGLIGSKTDQSMRRSPLLSGNETMSAKQAPKRMRSVGHPLLALQPQRPQPAQTMPLLAHLIDRQVGPQPGVTQADAGR